ncbi:hypothetical protein SAMN05661099_1185 [Daejeonella lutea]|uniref:Uncharacterized protein n=1 Tax=Daejeonella lutea TaxID=572036 RepID=A0A1T5B1M3_9SPHI|nr:hypothetical protein SAMN05661099_1185 [Daejeonella lutea]
MRILFIANNVNDEDVYKNVLSNIAERDSVYFVDSYDDAVDFINNRIVKSQEQLDLIIVKQRRYFSRTE